MTSILHRLEAVIAERRENPPESSYVASLLAAGEEKILKKLGEEAIETIIAARAEGNERLVSESADLLFHLLVLLGSRSIPLETVYGELEKRFGKPHRGQG